MIGKFAPGLAACLVAAAFVLPASAETYLRNGTEAVEVSEKGGRLYCTRLSDGYEMCNGLERRADGIWHGRRMKHPDMPRIATFNGVVQIDDGSLRIKGCTIGVCDSETWTRD